MATKNSLKNQYSNYTKYKSRPSPPYPAKLYPEEIKEGNDGREYYSKEIRPGIYRWIKYSSVKNHKSSHKRRIKSLTLEPKNKYNTRKAPPFLAKMCPGEIRTGNDGNQYKSTLLSNGQYRWVQIDNKINTNTFNISPKNTNYNSRRRSLTRPNPGSNPGPNRKHSPNPGPTSDKKQKWCRCVLHVATKQGPRCLKNRTWFQRIDGKVCTNPYAVCSKIVGTSSRNCIQTYNFNELSKQELLGLGYLERLNVNESMDKRDIINEIHKFLKNK